jgi:hemerythrin-like metal-binding protein
MRRKSVLDLFDLLPLWLYELLPGIYILSGICTFLLLDHLLAWMSSALLITSGLCVTWMRWRARQRRHHHHRDPEVVLLGMTWMRNYASGQPQMDAEHVELFELCHQILDDLLKGKGSAVDELVEELCESVERHFRNEEDVLRQGGAPEVRAHRRAHHRLVSQLRGLRNRQAKGQVPRAAVIQFVLHEMIRGHMVKEDIAPLEDIARRGASAARAV